MHPHRLAHPAVLLICLAPFGCGSSDAESGGAAGGGGAAGAGGAGGGGLGGAGATTSGYSAKLVSAEPTVGKSRFQLALTTLPDGQPATGLGPAIDIAPVMDMGGHAHGSPVPLDAVQESATAGTYDIELFFSMAGAWKLDVTVGDVAAGSFAANVQAPPGPDTTHVSLKSEKDTIKTPMGHDKPRNWYLFRDGLSAASGKHTFTVFLATVQQDAMLWPPATVGLKLVDGAGEEQLVVHSLEVLGSVDGQSWVALSCDPLSRCSGTLEGLASGVQDIFVKLAVNGSPYTTDGAAPDAVSANEFATFVVTAP